jgi:hypothetical protein
MFQVLAERRLELRAADEGDIARMTHDLQSYVDERMHALDLPLQESDLRPISAPPLLALKRSSPNAEIFGSLGTRQISAELCDTENIFHFQVYDSLIVCGSNPGESTRYQFRSGYGTVPVLDSKKEAIRIFR